MSQSSGILPTPNFILDEDYSAPVSETSWETIKFDKGIFVRPIDYYYVPQHVKDDGRYKNFDSTTHVFCYTRLGIYMFPKKIVRQV